MPIPVTTPVLHLKQQQLNKAAIYSQANGKITEVDADQNQIVAAKAQGFPDFGHNMKKYWPESNYINLNHGSLGFTPVCVIEAKMKMLWQMNARPDPWDRRHTLPMLSAVREEVAPLLGTVGDNVLIMKNARQAINTILYNLKYEPGDIIVMYSTTFSSISQMIKCVCDRNEGVRVEIIDVTFPCDHSEIVEATEAVLRKYNKPTGVTRGGDKSTVSHGVVDKERVRLVVMDGISCVPGVISPWEDITRSCHKYGALSLVDGAHLIGQQSVDVKKADPDFFVSNMHKWLYAHLSNSITYIAPRNQILIRTSFPTGNYYESEKYPRPGRPWLFAEQFNFNGTIDLSSYLTIPVALKFRRDIGGEERIIAYSRSIALVGGKRLAKRWSTSILENGRGELTACMVNVELPIAVPRDTEEQMMMQLWMEDMLMEADIFATMYVHNGKWYTRISGQVWVELSDFDLLGDAYDELAEAVLRGEHLHKRPPLTMLDY
ncbi:hypothetical protein CcaverHIS002_0305040 [Cutaneotrichosporon cavernicola]|nr:hypothetical protein CcaverHIS002_0305040 [Cutaneotrichosporon cavernicola]